MITEHAPLAPSSAPQWGYCSGSVAANRDAPDITCERTESGTASHWVAESVLTHPQPVRVGNPADAYIGRTAPNGVVVDEEMAEGAQAFIDDVALTHIDHIGPETVVSAQRFIEQRVEMPHIHPENWGTLDAALWVPDQDTLYLWDYKFGHREVEAALNMQLINYTAGLMALCPGMNTSTTVVMRVVQPFCYHAPEPIREWITTVDDLQFWFRQLHDKAHQAMGESPKMSSGKHCRDCHAVARCRTARRSTYSVIDYAAEPYEINSMDGADLAAERRILTTGQMIVKARLEAIEDQLHTRIASGDTSSGLTIQAGQGRLEWTATTDQVLALGSQFGADLSKSVPITPVQAIKAVPKPMRGAFEGVIQSITTRPPTGLKLIPVENSRTARAFKSKE